MTTGTLETQIEKIGKLLQQASDKGATEKEQDAFFRMAQKLASKYSVELEVARQAITNKQLRETPTQKRIQIGQAGKPLNAVFCGLFMDIGRAQGLKFNIAHNSTYVIAFGFPSDIKIAEAMYAHVVVQMVEMADAFIKGGTWKGDTTWDPNTWRHKPVHARVARRCFYESFSSRIGARLMEAKRETEKEMADEQVEVTNDAGTTEKVGTDIVLKSKAVEVSDFYESTSTARGSWKGNRGNTYTSNSGYSGGRDAANRARLGGQQSLPGGRRQIG